jgi:hypothetical protein
MTSKGWSPTTMLSARSWFVSALVVLTAACESLSGLSEGSSRSDASGDASHANDAKAPADASAKGQDAGECPIIVGALPCSNLPHFTGTQVVDGNGNEFCDIVATEFDVGRGYYDDPPDSGAGITTKAYIRAAWSSTGLHIHVHVDQATVNPPASGTVIYFGDGIEAFASLTDNLTGSFGPGADPAVQVIATPATATEPSLSSVATATTGITGTLAPSQFAGRLVPGGYEVEFELPWSVIAGGTDAGIVPVAGDSIGYDIACDVQGPNGTRLYQSSLSDNAPGPDTASVGTCTVGFPHPSCDDLIWCVVGLNP